jgi:transposase
VTLVLVFDGGLSTRPQMTANAAEALESARAGIDQTRLARLTTQSAIQRSRASLAETRAQLVFLRHAVGDSIIASGPQVEGEASTEARRLLEALRQIQNENA